VLLGIFFRFLYIPIYIRMEVMNVPQSRSRISLAPSMVKSGRGTKKGMMRKTARKAYEGEGIFDVVKSVGKAVAPTLIDLASQEAKRRVSGQGIFDVVKSVGSAVAPTLIDLASDYAKGKLGGMALPLNLSTAQKRTLKKGGAITINPNMIMEDAKQALAMLPATAKKVLGSLSKNKGIRVALKQGEDVIDRMTGKGLFDIVKSVGKAVAPTLIDLASQEAKRRVSGEGIFDVVKSVGKAVAPTLIDLASQEAKRRVGGGRMRKMPMSKGMGSPYVSAPYRQVMDNYSEGGSIFPAGGGIYPAGRYGGMVGMPIQQGSPYASINSPAMNPFIETRGIQSYDPIGKRGKQGGGPIGSVIGQVLGSFLPI
jgi:hypothetical protein